MKLPNLPNLSNLPSLADIPDDVKTMTVTLRHVLIVSHAVPAARVRPHVPAQFALDTLKVRGEVCAILQMVCCLNENFHYTPLPRMSLDFWQANYRVLTRQPMREATDAPGTRFLRSDPAAWMFKTYLGTKVAWVAQRAVASGAENANFNIIQRGDYAGYVADIQPGESKADSGAVIIAPPTQVAARALNHQNPTPPFAAWDKMVFFLTHRLNSYYRLSVGEGIGVLPVEHRVMTPRAAELVPMAAEIKEARFGVWEQMGLMNSQEMRDPLTVLIEPQVVCVTHAPHPLKKTA